MNATKLWTGGALTGLVAAGVAIVGLLIVRGILDVRVLMPPRTGDLINSNTWWYAAVSFIVALGATGLLHVLLLISPQPRRFFSWAMGVVVAIAVLAPFTTGANLDSKIATAAINLAIGLTITSLIGGLGFTATASTSARRPRTLL